MNNKNILLIISLYLLSACGKPTVENSEVAPPTDAITISPAQHTAAGIQLGTIELREISTGVHANGKLEVPPQNMITISAPMGGFVKSTELLQGMKIKKGDVLVTLENQEYIQLQQDYLDSRSKLEFLEEEYRRQTELSKENVNAQKTLQQAKAQYQSMKAIVAGLEAKLAMINIPAASLEDGKIKSYITLYAPLNSYVTNVNVSIGQFVNATDVMFKLVNLEHVHAELQVYEKDINKIAIGQQVALHLGNETEERKATVYLIGKEISPERTVLVHCHLSKEDQQLLPGSFITASIQTHASKATVVPNAAVVTYEGHSFVFVSQGNNTFKLIPIETGDSTQDYTEVVLSNKVNASDSIVVKGAFELLGLLKNTEE